MSKKGFTLIEMMSTIVIISVVALIATPIILNIIEKVRISAFKRDVEAALNSFIMQKQIQNIEEGAIIENMLVTDEELNLDHNKFISGGLYSNGITIYRAIQLTDGNYCGNGELGDIKVTRGSCEDNLNNFEVKSEEGWINRNKEIEVFNNTGIINEMYYLSNSNTKPSYEAEEWQNSNIFIRDVGIYYVFIKDEYGNISEGKKVEVDKIDKIKPELEIVIENMTTYFDTKIIVSEEGGSGLSNTNKYQYYISTSDANQIGGSWQNYTSGTSLRVDYVDNDIRYLWVYPIKDNAGNYSDENTDNTIPVCIGILDFSSFDTMKPTVTLTPISTTATNVTLKITVADEGLGLDPTNKYQYYLSTSNSTQTGGSWQNYTSGTNFTVSGTTGTYYLWVYSIKDKAGNYNGSYTSIKPYVIATYTFDSDKPTLSLTSSYTNITTVSVKITTADVGTGLLSSNKYQYYLSTSNTTQTGGSWKTYTNGTAFNITGTAGNYYLWVYPIQDKAGNYNESYTSITPYMIKSFVLSSATFSYSYTGGSQTFSVPYSGYYEIELWGASGSSGGQGGCGGGVGGAGGRGGYVKAKAYLTSGQSISVIIGGAGSVGTNACSTTGGSGGYSDGTAGSGPSRCAAGGAGGGGSSHIKIGSTVYVRANGGGGGAGGSDGGYYKKNDGSLTCYDCAHRNMAGTSGAGGTGGGGTAGGSSTSACQGVGGAGVAGTYYYNTTYATLITGTNGNRSGNGAAKITYAGQ